MNTNTILVDPNNNFESFPSNAQMVADYNASEPDARLHISEDDQNELNDLFLEAGLIEEFTLYTT